jgi:hypothetical protein
MRSVAGNDSRRKHSVYISERVKAQYGLEAIGKKLKEMLLESQSAQ